MELWGMFHYLILYSSVLLKNHLFTAVLDLPAARGLSLVVESGVWASHWVASLVGSTGSVVLKRVGCSWTRDRTCVPCIGRTILYP